MIARGFSFITIDRIVVAPMAASVGMASYLAGKLPVKVESLDLESILDLSAVPALRKAENQARYLVALGSALRGMRSTK